MARLRHYLSDPLRWLPPVLVLALLLSSAGSGLGAGLRLRSSRAQRTSSSPGHAARAVSRSQPEPAPAVLREADYQLLVDSDDAGVTVETLAGVKLTHFPLVALAGRSTVPGGVRATSTATPAGLMVTVTTASHVLLDQATIVTHPTYFTVTFQARLGPDPGLQPDFFYNGVSGLELSRISQGFTPDPRGPLVSGAPSTMVARHGPFSPPPLDLEFHSGPKWLGIGVAQVPDATDLSLNSDGAIQVNYPLGTLATVKDEGAGGTVGAEDGALVLGFPSFVFTFAKGPWDGLTAYHNALESMGLAPQAAPPGHRPSWWSWPLVDTWGQQVVDQVARTSPLYTASWARNYVKAWKAHYGLSKITLILDSQWQAQLGEGTPSARFGGVAGMRQLIAAFHAQGIHVLLWWPLWVRGFSFRHHRVPPVPTRAALPLLPGSIDRRLLDPTAKVFPSQLLSAIRVALGHGKGDLDADGLKLDWGQLTPNPNLIHFAQPQLGVGDAALFHYMTTLYQDAQKVHRGALIDASAVSPQFGGALDMIRLYDARGEATWEVRAKIIAATDPNALIDGDDWPVISSQAVAHAITSTVYGTPASYFLSHWFDGVPITKFHAHMLGSIMRLASQKGQGVARPLPGGGWSYWAKGQLTAETLAGNTAVAILSPRGCGQAERATVVSAESQRLSLKVGRSTFKVVARAGVPVHLEGRSAACSSLAPALNAH